MSNHPMSNHPIVGSPPATARRAHTGGCHHVGDPSPAIAQVVTRTARLRLESGNRARRIAQVVTRAMRVVGEVVEGVER
ncbi:hypothetical protein BN11_2000001 [Nostocoides australiense Ben110]|uniref:Uncharacterized protein n=1 Tax=Nostocoides australiense Ben110 TaxID=1193182 RepID=W6JTZ9_9MICO|nr:hypothetical protein BN11_2000001 [Tetrasphaera australiensis Ben110]